MTNTKIVVFGTGSLADRVVKGISQNISYFLDNDKTKIGDLFYGRDIFGPHKVLEEEIDSLYIIVASSFYHDIKKQLLEMGLMEFVHFINGVDLIDDYYKNESYSQEGEDLILNRIFGNKTSGFYVDIGAHHPKRFSNTYTFYKKGWSGINIDPLPKCMELFNIIRKRDINLELAISTTEEIRTYYMFDEPAINSFDKKLAIERSNNSNYKIIEEKKLLCKPLYRVLGEYLPEGITIDFMNIDVEGFELEILRSNDWELYRPNYILIEILKSDLLKINDEPVNIFLTNKNYILFAKTFNTFIYKSI